MSTFESTREAHRVARERASVAAALEAATLHTAIYDAREAGMSVREAAAALGVPKSVVARHWREGHRCTPPVPVWGSESAWREAHAAIWAHDPHAADDGSSPLSRGIHLLTRDFISRTCRILGTPSSHVSASRSHSPHVCGDHPPGDVSRLARRLKDLGGPSGLAPHNRLAPMDHPMSGRTYLARS